MRIKELWDAYKMPLLAAAAVAVEHLLDAYPVLKVLCS